MRAPPNEPTATAAPSGRPPADQSLASGRRRWPRPGRLRHRLALVQILAILIAAVLAALLVAFQSNLLLPRLAAIEDRVWAYRLAPPFEARYEREGSWAGVAALLAPLAQPLPGGLTADLGPALPWQPDPRRNLAFERYAVLDTDWRVVAASGPAGASGGGSRTGAGTGSGTPGAALVPGEPAPPLWRERAVELRVAGRPVGYLVASSGLMGEPAMGAFRVILWKTLAFTGLLAAALAFAASQLLARRLARPMERLAAAALALERGEPHVPLALAGADEIAETARAFDDMAAELQRQRRLRERMVADVAHELRTPVTVMRLELAAAADGLQSPTDACAVLAGELSALERLIEDLRLLSLADAGGVRLHREPIEAARLLDQIAGRWRDPQTGFALGVEPIAPGLQVQADPDRLRQILDILIDNARLHAGGRSQTPGPDSRDEPHAPASHPLEVRLGARRSPGGVELSVADNGPGIPPERLSAVFERFYRLDASRSRESGGSGLGLAIAARLTELHGGWIKAESDGREGTTFRLFLPDAHGADD